MKRPTTSKRKRKKKKRKGKSSKMKPWSHTLKAGVWAQKLIQRYPEKDKYLQLLGEVSPCDPMVSTLNIVTTGKSFSPPKFLTLKRKMKIIDVSIRFFSQKLEYPIAHSIYQSLRFKKKKRWKRGRDRSYAYRYKSYINQRELKWRYHENRK